nr:uncharacterized protein LOC128686406 isoform X1 [Cherax quadricarinatus]
MCQRSLLLLVVVVTWAGWAGGQTSQYCSFTPKHTMCKYSSVGPRCGSKVQTRGVGPREAADIVHQHNQLRSRVAMGQERRGVPGPQPKAANMKLMVWDKELAEVAQRHADQCLFKHDCADCRRVSRFSVGQNIFVSYQSNYDTSIQWDRALKSWYDEVALFSPTNIQPFKFTSALGHYTQMVWFSTDRVGCGYTMYQEGGWWKKLYTCNYGPGGNIILDRMYTRGTPCSSCPTDTSCSSKYPGLCKNSTDSKQTETPEPATTSTTTPLPDKTDTEGGYGGFLINMSALRAFFTNWWRSNTVHRPSPSTSNHSTSFRAKLTTAATHVTPVATTAPTTAIASTVSTITFTTSTPTIITPATTTTTPTTANSITTTTTTTTAAPTTIITTITTPTTIIAEPPLTFNATSSLHHSTTNPPSHMSVAVSSTTNTTTNIESPLTSTNTPPITNTGSSTTNTSSPQGPGFVPSVSNHVLPQRPRRPTVFPTNSFAHANTNQNAKKLDARSLPQESEGQEAMFIPFNGTQPTTSDLMPYLRRAGLDAQIIRTSSLASVQGIISALPKDHIPIVLYRSGTGELTELDAQTLQPVQSEGSSITSQVPSRDRVSRSITSEGPSKDHQTLLTCNLGWSPCEVIRMDGNWTVAENKSEGVYTEVLLEEEGESAQLLVETLVVAPSTEAVCVALTHRLSLAPYTPSRAAVPDLQIGVMPLGGEVRQKTVLGTPGLWQVSRVTMSNLKTSFLLVITVGPASHPATVALDAVVVTDGMCCSSSQC